MFCFRCGVEAENRDFCPNCGSDLRIMQRAVRISNSYYNDGLAKAHVRNLSGAILSLRTSLKFYKYNIAARNLLGLVLFETGETVNAITEWVISKNYQPEDNPACRYLDVIQNNPSHLESINQTIKKYNQALAYCKSDSRDLATIQLKKVLSLNPRFVKAHQLLALLYIQDEKYELAKKTLRNAGKIDTDNTTTLRYLKEVNARLKERGTSKKQGKDDLISYTNGNETIIMPKRFKETSLASTVVSVVIGLVIGVAATSFLVLPNVRSQYQQEAKSQLLDANDAITTSDQTISSLNKEIDSLEQKLKKQKASVKEISSHITEYDELLTAYTTYVAGDLLHAGELLSQVDTSKLSETAGTVYNSIHDPIMTAYVSSVYDEGYNAFVTLDYATAITDLKKVCDTDMNYQDGYAALYLGQAYEASGDHASAVTYFQHIIDTYPNTSRAATAEAGLAGQLNQNPNPQ